MPHAQLTLDLQGRIDHLMPSATGELDVASAPELLHTVSQLTLRPGQLPVMELSGLTFCDPSGINALETVRERARAARANTALAGLTPGVTRIFDLTRAYCAFPVHPTARHAVAALAG